MKKCFAIAFCLTISLFTQAQPITGHQRQQIDSIFKKWADPAKPGAVIGIVRNDSLIYTKGYGLADVEHNTPNTAASMYYMCSVSKQFAGYLIAQLVKEGKVDVNADIRTYLPWMGDLGAKVTVANLLHHTSGIRDDITIAGMTDKWDKGMLTEAGAIEILKRQRSLNFTPGQKFAYSNSNYVLLAEIVQAVWGKPFRQVAEQQIFKPLGMVSSKFVDDPYELISDRASSYSSQNGKLSLSLQDVYTMGDGGLFTNMNDLAKWAINLYRPADKAVVDQLLQQGILNNGERIKYAFGISIEESLGHKQYFHNGSLAGYRTAIGVFPEQKMGFMIFGNGGESEVAGKLTQLAALFIAPKKSTAPTLPTPARRDSALATVTDRTEADKRIGTYIADDGYRVDISLIRNKLWINRQVMLKKDSADSYSLLNNQYVRYVFVSGGGIDKLLLYSPALATPIEMDRSTELTDKKASGSYIGSYTSPELGYSFDIMSKNGALWFVTKEQKEYKVRVYHNGHLSTDNDSFGHFKGIRNKAGKLIGLELNKGGMMHLRFDRMSR
ncbi:serine hydrolase domain-containing protein [Mucilaginibacter myungsuensis]|uniref:Beta-lactamase family protein n=1 Tax=Mucilaginibacter myungsuensis TaxID=649104 RepID=A0A929L4L2_9SPHI|nr:serine hydrolase domain-containing protein [Mucilaginibacter myungsuensis]MBE9663915.1 beta-lactamase family protein [Mucilaginibacter myungsuensis]MDN3598369.1 serine hydrolase domain-containing protein [Mucilaginibacter myungsuensis]